ncbi:MAG: SGNH/GDSL hydrolase family protein [Bacteriovoracaceae bacterium]
MKNHEIKLFSRPLVLGASISAGYGTRDGGLGAVLAKTINPDAKVINKAKSGATSVQSTSHLQLSTFDPSIVLGLDLFFWDAAREQTGKRFEKNTKRLFDEFRERNVPMILGKVPILDLPFIGGRAKDLIESARKVNGLLEELSFTHPNSVLYDPVPCFLSMGFGAKKYFSDGLHLNSEGNRYCVNYFLSSGEHRKLKAVA